MSNYKGQIEGFPSEVVEKMLERQVEQGNKRDVRVFEKNKSAGPLAGFSWCKTAEEYGFWSEVIENKNFALFFSRYPKKNKFTPISEETGKKLVEAIEKLRLGYMMKEIDSLVTSNMTAAEFISSSEWKPKEGDVIVNKYNVVGIYKNPRGSVFNFYAALYENKFYTNMNAFNEEIRPATYEECCTFFSRLVNEGYKWNAKKLKLTKWEPKDGDFIYWENKISGGYGICILEGQYLGSGEDFFYYVHLASNNTLRYTKVIGKENRMDRSATDSERQRLLDALRKEGKKWNAEKKRIEDVKPTYSIGDIILANDRSIAIVSRIGAQGCYEISAVLTSEGELYINDGIISITFPSDFIKRKANKQEVSKLNEALAKAGYRRSAKMGVIEPLKWKPKMGERYFVPSKKSKYGFNESIWSGSEFDIAYESIGIICRTGEEAQKMLNK